MNYVYQNRDWIPIANLLQRLSITCYRSIEVIEAIIVFLSYRCLIRNILRMKSLSIDIIFSLSFILISSVACNLCFNLQVCVNKFPLFLFHLFGISQNILYYQFKLTIWKCYLQNFHFFANKILFVL